MLRYRVAGLWETSSLPSATQCSSYSIVIFKAEPFHRVGCTAELKAGERQWIPNATRNSNNSKRYVPGGGFARRSPFGDLNGGAKPDLAPTNYRRSAGQRRRHLPAAGDAHRGYPASVIGCGRPLLGKCFHSEPEEILTVIVDGAAIARGVSSGFLSVPQT